MGSQSSSPWQEERMKNLVLGLVLAVAVWGLAGAGLVQAAGPGTVAGVIEVHKARVKTRGAKSFKDVVVYLEPLVPAVYPPPSEHAVMDQRGLVFIPHVMAVQKGTTVDFLNSDNDRHNVYFLHDKTGDTLDIGTWGPGETVSHTFRKTGLVITLCQLHLEMAAHILVLEYPFFTVAAIDGETQRANYEIKDVPAGDYVLKAWHKKLKMKTGSAQVTVVAGQNASVDFAITGAKYAE
jgi:plastocyanin